MAKCNYKLDKKIKESRMKKIVSYLTLFLSIASLCSAKDGYTAMIQNNTDYQLKISAYCTNKCPNKNDPSCKPAEGYVIIIPAHKSSSLKKRNMAYEINNPNHENTLKLEIYADRGQIKIAPKIIANPSKAKKKYAVSLDKNNILVVR